MKKRKPGPKLKYETEAQRKAANREFQKKWRELNPERWREIQFKAQDKCRRKLGMKKRKRVPQEYFGRSEIEKLEARVAELEREKKEGIDSLLENRVKHLETELKDILLDLEEVLKDNKETKEAVKWGKEV